VDHHCNLLFFESSTWKEGSELKLRLQILRDRAAIVIKVDYSGIFRCGEGGDVVLDPRGGE